MQKVLINFQKDKYSQQLQQQQILFEQSNCFVINEVNHKIEEKFDTRKIYFGESKQVL